MRGDGKPKEAGTWDWFGACAPAGNQHYVAHVTFSVGVFQWVGKQSGGTKRGKIVKRISGSVYEPQSVYDEANAECDRRSA